MDYNFIIAKVFDKVVDILFPTSDKSENDIKLKQLENDELEIRLLHESKMLAIIKISEKWEREHVERKILLFFIGEALRYSNDLNLPEEQRKINNKRCEQFTNLLASYNTNSQINSATLSIDVIDDAPTKAKTICPSCNGKGLIMIGGVEGFFLDVATLGLRRFISSHSNIDSCTNCNGTGFI